jgi:hypothetical protein
MGAISVIRQKPSGRQDVVVCKILTAGVCGAEVLPESRLALELSCCLQDSGVRCPPARPLRRNALGRKLSCCLQDRADAAFGPERAAVGGSAQRRRGAVGGTAANTPGCETAISGGCQGIPGGIAGPRRSSGGDTQRGGGAGNRDRHRPPAPVDISRAGKSAHRSGIAVRPYRRLSHPAGRECKERGLETAIEWVLHPGRWQVL